MKTILIVPPATQAPPQDDPYYPAAVENAKAAAKRLQDAGIIDAQGRRIRTDLPVDMQENSDRDCGG